ncbi:MAG: hypothetical protein MJ246_01570 [Clostridia bacterium]|nr:hypothetical protein [Clostridia bacterium]
MSNEVTPIGKRLEKITEIYEVIAAAMPKGETKSVNLETLNDLLREAYNDEKVALMKTRIGENLSKIRDIDKVNANIESVYRGELNNVYGANLTSAVRQQKRYEMESEIARCRTEFLSMNKTYADVRDEKDYIVIKAEREDRGRITVEEVYNDLRKYTPAQIESNLTARFIYKLIVTKSNTIEYLQNNPVCRMSIEKVIGSMNAPDLNNLIDSYEDEISRGIENFVVQTIEDTARNNGYDEFLMSPMPDGAMKHFIHATNKYIEIENLIEEDEEILVVDDYDIPEDKYEGSDDEEGALVY